MPGGLQEWIHKLEEGEWARWLGTGLLLLVLLAVTAIYDVREFKNFATQEAMDSAQLARNIAEGRGYTTRFIRPFSLGLVQQHRPDKNPLLKDEHPDLANAPVYPTVLAGLMKVLPFQYKIGNRSDFEKYQPEVLIAAFNQAMFFLAAVLLFRLALKLFDRGVAWISTLVFLGSGLFWRFSISGLPTLLLLLIFLGIVWCLVLLERAAAPPEPLVEDVPVEPGAVARSAPGSFKLMALAAAAGALTGVAGMTLYSFGWLIVPVAAFLALYFPTRRLRLTLAAIIAFAVVMTPWLARNHQICGKWFGTAGYAIYQETFRFKGTLLERSIAPDLSKVETRQFFYKFMDGFGDIVSNQLPKLGGSWVSGFFLVGLLVQFRSSTLVRLRMFLLFASFVLIVVQALGRSRLSADVPEVNSENLLIVLAPLVFMFGVAFYFALLDQMSLPFVEARLLVTGAFVMTAAAPLLITLLPPRSSPYAYPPYFPPGIQEPCDWLTEKELMMSDMPWASAWYGHRQSLWLTLKSPLQRTNDFFLINDFQKPIRAVYLTPLTLDEKFRSQMLLDDSDWGRFILQFLLKNEVPPQFVLRQMPNGYLPNQFLLMDRDRWNEKVK